MVTAALRLVPERTASEIAWEEPNCPLCNGRRRVTKLEAPDPSPEGGGLWFAVVECQDCGLYYTCPRPDEESIGGFYPAGYGPHQAQRRDEGHTGERRCAERRPFPVVGHGKLLDFGCGAGVFLDLMRREGWDVTGLDMSNETVARLRTDHGLRVLQGSLPHPELEPASFNAVTMWHALEHVHNPFDVLKAAKRLLAPGGQVHIAVPNIECLAFRWFGRSWYGLELPRHLTHFSEATLRAMLQRVGFWKVKIEQVKHSDWVRNSARLAAGQGRSNVFQRTLLSKRMSRAAASYGVLRGRADGLYALAAI